MGALIRGCVLMPRDPIVVLTLTDVFAGSTTEGENSLRTVRFPSIVGSAEAEEVLEGVVEDVVFQSEDGRYSVIRLSRDSEPSDAPPRTAVGDLGQIAAGEHVRLVGRWTQHAVYGPRFRVHSFTPTIPESTSSLVG